MAGILAAKRCGELIPLCHPLALDHVALDFERTDSNRLRVQATVSITAPTGIEMEALTAVSIAALALYDMVKGVDRAMTIGPTRLIAKSGGASGAFLADSGLEPASDGALPPTATSPGVER